MNLSMKKSRLLVICGLAAVVVSLASWVGHVQPEAAAAEPASESASFDGPLERARREIRLLDDIYKTSIVLITTHYVTGDEDLAAGSAFKALFQAVADKGWHQVRLIDASGEPYNDENSPQEGFESRAIGKLKAGEAWYDEVEEEGDQRFLRVATAIPVVMEKCIMCHENYRDVKEGVAIGAIGYRLPILTDADLEKE